MKGFYRLWIVMMRAEKFLPHADIVPSVELVSDRALDRDLLETEVAMQPNAGLVRERNAREQIEEPL
jgi:hypothetical protein